jgi:hypothetical protein
MGEHEQLSDLIKQPGPSGLQVVQLTNNPALPPLVM